MDLFSNPYMTTRKTIDLTIQTFVDKIMSLLFKSLSRFVVAVLPRISVVSDSLLPHGLYSPWNSPGQNTGVGIFSLLQGIFPTQGSNQGLPHCRWILYQLSHKGSPRILEWVAYPSSQWLFLTHELNRGLLHCRQILYQLSYEGSSQGTRIFYFHGCIHHHSDFAAQENKIFHSLYIFPIYLP